MAFFPFNIFRNIFRFYKFPFSSGFIGMPFLVLFAYLVVTAVSVLVGVHLHKKTNDKVWLILSGVPSVVFIFVFILFRIVKFLI